MSSDKRVAKAVSKNVKISAKKGKRIAEMVRGLDAFTAINTLKFMNNSGSEPIRKTIESAVSNLTNEGDGHQADPKNVIVRELIVEQGPMLKRLRPGAQGRASIIRRRLGHIKVTVEEI
ncbi:50S ribosomal protein L22 [candidate division TA06 bacterium]|jgi:large subunit ribosomal protein L22|uniref:Large ribosomal subunit protein uL22 n=1 Tax=candidate division TA06 bacterium TaxID=2250710 RepID=A0A660S7G8_UNCT6|nr:MAG: 50S ribosomal protein L22 [candidate division TA06 bacterium]